MFTCGFVVDRLSGESREIRQHRWTAVRAPVQASTMSPHEIVRLNLRVARHRIRSGEHVSNNGYSGHDNRVKEKKSMLQDDRNLL